MNPDRKIYTVKENDENGYDLFFTNITSNIPALNIWEDEKLHHVTRVSIPDGVTTIEKNAFQYFENLRSIEIPNSVTRIESCAFENCTSLSYVKMSDNIIHIGAYAFHNCRNLNLTRSWTSPKTDSLDTVYTSNMPHNNEIRMTKQGSSGTLLLLYQSIADISRCTLLITIQTLPKLTNYSTKSNE